MPFRQSAPAAADSGNSGYNCLSFLVGCCDTLRIPLQHANRVVWSPCQRGRRWCTAACLHTSAAHSVIHELSGLVGEKKPAKADQAAGLTLTNAPNRRRILISFFYKYPRKESDVYWDTHTEHVDFLCWFVAILWSTFLETNYLKFNWKFEWAEMLHCSSAAWINSSVDRLFKCSLRPVSNQMCVSMWEENQRSFNRNNRRQNWKRECLQLHLTCIYWSGVSDEALYSTSPWLHSHQG